MSARSLVLHEAGHVLGSSGTKGPCAGIIGGIEHGLNHVCVWLDGICADMQGLGAHGAKHLTGALAKTDRTHNMLALGHNRPTQRVGVALFKLVST